MKQKDFKLEVAIPEGTNITIDKTLVKVKGPKGEVAKEFKSKKVKLQLKDNKFVINAPMLTKKEKKIVYTFEAHVVNMIKGVTDGHVYKLKICSGHFPMNVSVTKEQVSVKNFLGEKIPRNVKIPQGVNVKNEGDIITVESPDKELAGQTAASIEQLTRVTNRDLRIFQDGIYIIEKSGKEMQ